MSPPISVLELRSVRGTGGGPEKTILLGTAGADPGRFKVTVCYLRDRRDAVFHIDERAATLPIDYVEIEEAHSLDPRIWRALRDVVDDRRVDIVHAHDYKTDALALLLARARGIVPLATAHGWTGHSLRERLLYYPLDRRLLARFPRVIAVSSEIRSALVAAGTSPASVSVVLNGIDHVAFRRRPELVPTAREAFGIGPEDFVIGSVGRLEPQKDFPLLLRSFHDLSRERSHARLIIAGDGSLRQELSSLIAALGLQDRCRLLGHVSDVPLFHHAIDLFVQSSAYEGTPNTVLEAMAFETPVVATDAGGTAELARHDAEAIIVAPGDQRGLLAAMRRAIEDGPATRARARAARARVETDLSFESRMRRVEAIYEDLIELRAVRTSGSRSQ